MKQITNIPIDKLRPFDGHPYKVLDNEEMNDLIGSIQESGILTPLLWEKGRRASSVAGLGAAVSLLVELSQLLDNRSSDVDDLIVNTAGALLGFGGYKLWVRRAGEPGRKTPVSLLPLCILVPFVGRFFLFNEMGLARLLYGF